MQLIPFQSKAVAWLQPRDVAFLALEQGLGKTIVSAVDVQPFAIVVCPASLKFVWEQELALWRPELRTYVITKTNEIHPPVDVVIVSYEMLYWTTFEQAQIKGGKRKRTIHLVDFKQANTLVIDEAHYCKSYDSVRTTVIKRHIRAAKRCRILSGTLMPNRPIELWPLLNATGVTKMGYYEFGMYFCKGWRTPWDTLDFSGASNTDELAEILSTVMLRLTKEQVLPELPPRSFRVIELDVPVDEREKQFNVDDIERNPTPIAFEALPDVLHMNAHRKLPMALEYITNVLENTKKVVVFAHHRDIVEALLEGLKEFNPVFIVGGVKPEDRKAAVHRFQNDDSCRVFVGNLIAAGVGYTLHAASHVVFVESSWTPKDLLQCVDRCHRIGQKFAVTGDILTIRKSIDATMLHSVLRKMEVIKNVIKETDMSQLDNVAIAVKLRELADLFAPAAVKPTEALATKEAPAAPKVDSGASSATAEEKSAPAATATITIDQVREGMAKLIDAGKRETALKILKDHGASKVGELKEDKFQSALDAINAALA